MRSDLCGDAAISQWMRCQGDALLRTCYLLCGDLKAARRIARRAFAQAWAKRSALPAFDERAALLVLLREAMRLCPCEQAQPLPFARRDFIARLRALAPEPRQVTLLCLYHGLSAREAAQVLGREEARVLSDLRRARELLDF